MAGGWVQVQIEIIVEHDAPHSYLCQHTKFKAFKNTNRQTHEPNKPQYVFSKTQTSQMWTRNQTVKPSAAAEQSKVKVLGESAHIGSVFALRPNLQFKRKIRVEFVLDL